MTLRTALAAFALAGLTMACGTTTSFTPTNTSPKPMAARSPDSVEVYQSSKPDKPFVEVGMIEAQQSSEFSTDDTSAVIAALRTEAAQRGCDGIIITGSNDAVVGSVSDGEGYTDTLKGYRAACFMYK